MKGALVARRRRWLLEVMDEPRKLSRSGSARLGRSQKDGLPTGGWYKHLAVQGIHARKEGQEGPVGRADLGPCSSLTGVSAAENDAGCL